MAVGEIRKVLELLEGLVVLSPDSGFVETRCPIEETGMLSPANKGPSGGWSQLNCCLDLSRTGLSSHPEPSLGDSSHSQLVVLAWVIAHQLALPRAQALRSLCAPPLEVFSGSRLQGPLASILCTHTLCLTRSHAVLHHPNGYPDDNAEFADEEPVEVE